MSVLAHIAALGRVVARSLAPTPDPKPDEYKPGPSCLHPGGGDAGYVCKCHQRMGNDFWFLPSDRCLWDKK